ncbi:unnamed protein product [Rhizoctonia solani]|uniref:Uncharacterized protein n=1 Tax=Rhizoctonia solani TaxID=456999 RepID=A0A8H3CFH0_9AGAM|nr:unnamed protein product [Rhizoctonia solani]
MNEIFRIPELLRLIWGFGQTVDNVHLALTCRDLFTRAIPLAWAHVLGADQLLMLIDGTTCEELNEDRVLGAVKVKLPDNFEDISLCRFNFYAPFVTSLEIYKHQYQKILIPRLESFAQATSARGALPNLKCLTISSAIAPLMERISWIDIFSCSSLVEVRIPCMEFDNFPSTTHAAATRITNSLYRHRPNIRKLELFWDNGILPFNDSDDNLPEMHGVPTCNIETTIHKSLSRYIFLTSIIGGMSLLGKSMLLTLGSLPELRHLEIHYPLEDLDNPELEQPVFPPRSFPKLKSLVLSNVVEPTAKDLWNMAALVAQLQSVTIKFMRPLDSVDDQDELILNSFIPLLCMRSPYINELVLEFNCDTDQEEDGPIICSFTEAALIHITMLKLTRLEVIHAFLDGTSSLDSLSNSWPGIEVLRWPDQHIKLSDLPLFVGNLPKLKHLALEIDFPLPFDEALIEKPSRISQHQLQVLESSFRRLGHLNGDPAYKLYWYLRELIPNAKLETRPDPYLDSFPDRKFDLACVNSINLMERFLGLMQKHAPSEDTEQVRKRVGMVWDTVRLNTMKEIQPGDIRRMMPSQIAQ